MKYFILLFGIILLLSINSIAQCVDTARWRRYNDSMAHQWKKVVNLINNDPNLSDSLKKAYIMYWPLDFFSLCHDRGELPIDTFYIKAKNSN